MTATDNSSPGRGLGVLLIMLGVGLVWRLLYVWAQTGVDPWYAQPQLDGAYYIEWARGLLGGEKVAGAFYLAPLYPYLLAALFLAVGENFFLLYLFQQLLSLASAGLIGYHARDLLGVRGALCAAGLFLLYHPLLFFASRPLGETLAIFLLVLGLVTVWRAAGAAGNSLAGVLTGAAALARTNLLLVPVGWWVAAQLGRNRRRSWWLVLGVVVLVAPVTLRNRIVSGHIVLVSSNAGLTAYHGNGPGARGIFTHPDGFTGEVGRQREEATALARSRSGRSLDAVEADAWWGRQALRTRLDDPGGTVRLVLSRAVLLLDSHEYGLDYPPALDPNPWRPELRIAGLELPLAPWAFLVGLSVAALILRGTTRSGGTSTWVAIVACVATPILFYVSSRYRLPLAALLTIPAGSGLAALTAGPAEGGRRRWRAALAAALVVSALSLAVPRAGLRRTERAEGLSNRALAYRSTGRLVDAAADARRSVELLPGSARLQFNLGVILGSVGDSRGAESAYVEALRLEPRLGRAAHNLASLLFREGRFEEAAERSRRALRLDPGQEGCWNIWIAALIGGGRMDAAREAVKESRRAGVRIDPGLLAQIERAGAQERQER